MVSAAAFGRSVGMRVYVSLEDIAEFHRRYFTSSTMELEFGLHKRTLLAKLKEAKVQPFAPSGQDFGTLYLSDEVEAVIKSGALGRESVG